MMSKLITFIRDFFSKGSKRTLKAKKHILISFGLKGLSIASSYILVPMTLNYLGDGNTEIGQLKYGIWLTLSSIIGWFGFFDIGIGNGLRNKFAEALAKNDKILARSYVSTAYAIFILIFGLFFLVFLGVNPFLDWISILNAPAELSKEIGTLVIFVVFFFCTRFVINLISTILLADQRPAVSNSINPVGNILSLIIVLFLIKFSSGSLLYLGLAFTLAPLLVIVIFNFYFFNKDYKAYMPHIKYVDLKHFKDLGNIGFQFFVIQMAVMVIFYTDNMIITQIDSLGPKEVTPYNIAFKYFNLATMVFNIIITPFWSAYTEAFAKNDYNWIKKSQSTLIKIWAVLLVGIAFMVVISNWFYHLWVPGVSVPFLLSVFMGLFIVISTWNNIFAQFLNGTGKIRLSLYLSVLVAAVNIPLSIYFAKNLQMGSAGVILGTCVTLMLGFILGPVQYYLIINKKAKGVWNK